MPWLYRSFSFSLFLMHAISSTIFAESTIEHIYSDIAKNKYDELGGFLKNKINKEISLLQLQQIAQTQGAAHLLNAVNATIAFYSNGNNLKVPVGDFFQAALFIERKRIKYLNEKTYFLSKEETGLEFPLTLDRRTGNYFINLEGNHRTFLGQGKKKVVVKSVLYDFVFPKIVARGEQIVNKASEKRTIRQLKREVKITRVMRGAPGLFTILGVNEHRGRHEKSVNIYSQLYYPGELQAVILNKVPLSMYEKMQAAVNILRGLESLHTRGVVHRDLGARNYLINIPAGPIGTRNVVAVIADLGRAEFAKEVSYTKVQGNTTYAAPEALFKDKMKWKKYFATDIFATGCTFYFLFHGKKAPWQDFSYLKDKERPVKVRHRELVHRINKETRARRLLLISKRESGTISKQESFELVILRMLSINPADRGTATELRQLLELIINAP